MQDNRNPTALKFNQAPHIQVKDGERSFNESKRWQLLDFNTLPFMLQDSVLGSLKNTRRFKGEGNTWFYGLALEGLGHFLEHSENLFSIDYTAKKPEDTFKKIAGTEGWGQSEFHNRMRIFKGPYPMQVGIYSGENNGNDAFMEIHCSLKPSDRAPTTVCIEKSMVSPEKQNQIDLAARLAPYLNTSEGILDPRLHSLLVEIAKSLRK